MLELLKILLARWFPVKAEEPSVVPPVAMDRDGVSIEIHTLVWAGFESQDAIVEIVTEEYFTPDEISEIDRRWIRAEISRQFAEKRRQEATWPARTDWERLDAAFVELRATGIIALHDAGMTQADGFSDVVEEFNTRKEVGVTSDGFVFYNGQDVDTALSEGELYLAFGAFEKRDENTPVIAAKISGVLAKKGLRANWDGDLGKRIVVQPIEWLKRSPSD